jgi:hypothetical protein
MTHTTGFSLAHQILELFQRGFIDHRSRCTRTILLGFTGTLAQAAALLSLIPILRNVDASRGFSSLGLSVDGFDMVEYSLYVIGISLLFVVSVRMKYLVYANAYRLSGDFAVDCAEKVFTSLRANATLADRPRAAVQSVATRCLFRMTMACSVLFRQILLSLNDIILLVVFLLVLFYLSPGATLVTALLSLPLLLLYIRSYTTIAAQAEEVERHRSKSRDEVRTLVETLRDKGGTSREVGSRVRSLFQDGYAGETLFEQMAMRSRMKGSSAVVELITPVSIVVIASLLYFSESLGLELATVLAYYIILRQAITASNQVADSLIMINRVFPDLRDYSQIVNHNKAFIDAWLDKFDGTRSSAADPDDD